MAYYFQWQNPVLEKTIYPLRAKKLRDFLVYMKEFELWGVYKNKAQNDLQTDIQEFITAKTAAIRSGVDGYNRLKSYFVQADMRPVYAALYPELEETVMTKINGLHTNFAMYLPKMTDIRRESYFVSQQLPTWMDYRKEVRAQVVQRRRRLAGMLPNHPKRPIEEKQADLLEQVGLDMIERELIQLKAFIECLEQVAPRRQVVQEMLSKAGRNRQDAERQLQMVLTQTESVRSRLEPLQEEVARLKNPPSLQEAERAFKEASAQDARYKTALDEFNRMSGPQSKLYALQNQQRLWRQELRNQEKATAGAVATAQPRSALASTMRSDLSKLADFYASYEVSIRPAAEIAKTLRTKETEKASLEQQLIGLQGQQSNLQAAVDQANRLLGKTEDDLLLQYEPERPLRNKDIAIWKAERYQTELEQKSAQQLMEEIVQLFVSEPTRFPIWLQYMVIHFSGMRYASAHGSWADGRNLLVRLHAAEVEKRLKTLESLAVTQELMARVTLYRSGDPAAPALARASDPNWVNKRELQLNGMKGGPQTKRTALTTLLIMEYEYELAQLSETEAMQRVEALKDRLPAWAWKEVVRLTELRVNHVTDPGWEKPTQAEEQESQKPENFALRQVISKWKEDYTTLWRDEHGRSQRLIVSRAVCNETAEHCQHLRGQLPPGGLTAKAPWYMRLEKELTASGAYFTKARSLEQYKPGASILWVRFVHERPNEWRIARPLATKEGDTLIAAELMGRRKTANNSEAWVYAESDAVTRTRSYLTPDKQRVNQQQWLRWIHEATVAMVGETAEGPVVLTYETALPDDDPSFAAIGVFKLSAGYVLGDGSEENYNRSFVGFTPEGKLPYREIRDMLDWNKILLREALPPAQLKAYQDKYLPV